MPSPLALCVWVWVRVHVCWKEGGGNDGGEVNGGAAVFPVSLATQWEFGVKKALNLTPTTTTPPTSFFLFSVSV